MGLIYKCPQMPANARNEDKETLLSANDAASQFAAVQAFLKNSRTEGYYYGQTLH